MDTTNLDGVDNAIAVSREQAARLVNVSLRTITTEISQGRLRSAKVGERRLIPLAELYAWLERSMSDKAA